MIGIIISPKQTGKNNSGNLVSPETSHRHQTEKRQQQSRDLGDDRQTFRGFPGKKVLGWKFRINLY